MPLDRLVTPFMRSLYDPARPHDHSAPNQHQPLDPATRVALLDAQGIDVQHVITGTGYTVMSAVTDPALGRDLVRAVNTCMSDGLAEYRDRLLPVALMHYGDLDQAVAELHRMRARGARAFHVTTEFANDVPPFHPDFDKVWSAATDLGMIAVLHVGLMPPRYHPAYANTDDPALLRRMATSQSFQAAQVYLNAMVFGGVFERHPDLTLLLCETGIGWLEFAVENMDGRATPGAAATMGPYELSLRPSEFVRRNVRVSPLPQAAQCPKRLFETLPEVAVFSSDMPHFEGSLGPVDFWNAHLTDVDPAVRARFLGAGIDEVYSRMGDPLPGEVPNR
jgi:predicted TIM-barrel fold metal-dependent hydrolase